MTAELLLTILKLGLTCVLIVPGIASAQSPMPSTGTKPNIVVIWGDDIGQFNVSVYNLGMMGYRTPNIDRIARENALFSTGTASRAAPPAARRSSPGSRPSAPA